MDCDSPALGKTTTPVCHSPGISPGATPAQSRVQPDLFQIQPIKSDLLYFFTLRGDISFLSGFVSQGLELKTCRQGPSPGLVPGQGTRRLGLLPYCSGLSEPHFCCSFTSYQFAIGGPNRTPANTASAIKRSPQILRNCKESEPTAADESRADVALRSCWCSLFSPFTNSQNYLGKYDLF